MDEEENLQVQKGNSLVYFLLTIEKLGLSKQVMWLLSSNLDEVTLFLSRHNNLPKPQGILVL